MALLLASALLLLLAPAALLLAFLALLLISAAGEPAYEALGLVGYTSHGVLRPLDGLPCLVGHLAGGFLRSTLLLLLLLASSTLGL